MAKTYINGYPVTGSTSYASAITCVDKDGNKSTVQEEMDKLNDGLNYRVGENLLINSNFTNSVMQRMSEGQYQISDTELLDVWALSEDNSRKHTIDRWSLIKVEDSASVGLIVKSNKGEVEEVTLTGDASDEHGWMLFGQAIEELPFGTYTFSMCIDNKVHTATLNYQGEPNVYAYPDEGVGLGIGYYSTYDIQFVYVSLDPKKLNTRDLGTGILYPCATLQWAKLERGEVATPYVPRTYTEEYLLCQRYYQWITYYPYVFQVDEGNVIYDSYPIIPMRTNPSVLYGGISGTQGSANINSVELYNNGSTIGILYLDKSIATGACVVILVLDAEF